MTNTIVKCSALHNLLVTSSEQSSAHGELPEGLVIPREILAAADIAPYEQLVVTKINGSNWVNRIRTFAVPGNEKGNVEARGSVSSFLKVGDMICAISYCFLDDDEYCRFLDDRIPIFDFGFIPADNRSNLGPPQFEVQFHSRKERVTPSDGLIGVRRDLKRMYLSSLILNLQINKTHPDCLHGSAEVPREILEAANLKQYQAVTVFNSSRGGFADTYAVYTEPKVVMTTGAMSSFATMNEIVNVAAYCLRTKTKETIHIAYTNGCELIRGKSTLTGPERV
jgi:aspartate 1-decarboxylase